METIKLSNCIGFKEEKMQKIPIFESDKLFFDHYCLLPGQHQKVHSHKTEDKIYIVMQGIATFDIGNEIRDLTAGNAVIARATVPHGVKNNTQEKLVLLVTMAPRPAPKK
ncbi:MAG: cupin domain-containing protein [Calditrichia bacterium]